MLFITLSILVSLYLLRHFWRSSNNYTIIIKIFAWLNIVLSICYSANYYGVEYGIAFALLIFSLVAFLIVLGSYSYRSRKQLLLSYQPPIFNLKQVLLISWQSIVLIFFSSAAALLLVTAAVKFFESDLLHAIFPMVIFFPLLWALFLIFFVLNRYAISGLLLVLLLSFISYSYLFLF